MKKLERKIAFISGKTLREGSDTAAPYGKKLTPLFRGSRMMSEIPS
ncbi:MAG: hypothetical protein IJ641_06340 [Lachnospiraceae bacterium]|nr:hypothetical protein [Lachnospiraceae bacterium]